MPSLSRQLATLLIEGLILDTLSIRYWSPDCFHPVADFWQRPSTPIPARGWDSLVSLELQFIGWPVLWRTEFLPPSLVHLSLQFPDIDERLTGFLPSTISHPNLRSLNLHCNWTSAWILETVASCPKLDKLVLRIELYDQDRNYDDPFLHADQVYRHTNLRDLRLEGYPASDGRYDLIVRQLALPSLVVELDIKLEERSTSFLAIKYLQSDIEITAHISDSWKHLRVFRLRGPYRINDQYKEDVNFETICSIIHPVTHLTLSKIDFDTESILLRGLGHLPHLKTLELLGVSPNLHYDALLAFIKSANPRTPNSSSFSTAREYAGLGRYPHLLWNSANVASYELPIGLFPGSPSRFVCRNE